MATRKWPPPKPPNYMVLEKEGPVDGEHGTSDSKQPQAPGTHLPASKANAYQIIRQDAAIKTSCNTSPGKLVASSQGDLPARRPWPG